jgi:hypothetical protein
MMRTLALFCLFTSTLASAGGVTVVEVADGSALKACLEGALLKQFPERKVNMWIGPIQGEEPTQIHYVVAFNDSHPRYQLQLTADTGWTQLKSEILGYSASQMSGIARAEKIQGHCASAHAEMPQTFDVDVATCFAQ